MQIVNVDPAFDRLIADFVGHSHVSAASDVSSGKPPGEGVGVMITSRAAFLGI